MPTPREINTAVQIAEEYRTIIAANVYNQLQGIAKQEVWITRDRTLIYTTDLDLDTIDKTILDIIAGNHAMICIEKESGVDPAEANLFDTYVRHTLIRIIAKLKEQHHTAPRKCTALLKTIQTALHGYWPEL